MEIILIIVVLVAAIFFVSRLGHSEGRSRPSQTTSTSEPPSTRVRSSAIRTAKPSRFDEKNSTHLPQKQILTGAVYVTDGDTIKIGKTQIRLFGVDAPELNHPYGKKAKWALHKLCKGQIVRAEISERDEYGRTVAQCYLSDGRDLSAEMVKLGLAIDWPKFSGGKYRNLETTDARKKLFLADARQKGWMHVWEKYEAKQAGQ
ncbi:thermonuclease family protein [Rhodobacteraceae bacterium F11138]|nr:thermonuclease family protein [Rhodobacteraceae bacterium F11138]